MKNKLKQKMIDIESKFNISMIGDKVSITSTQYRRYHIELSTEGLIEYVYKSGKRREVPNHRSIEYYSIRVFNNTLDVYGHVLMVIAFMGEKIKLLSDNSEWDVHHINGGKQDYNIDNLEIKELHLHRSEAGKKRWVK